MPERRDFDADRSSTIPWIVVIASMLFGVWSLELGYQSWMEDLKPQAVSVREAGLFYLLNKTFGSPLDTEIASTFLFVEGVVCIVLPLYLKFKQRSKKP